MFKKFLKISYLILILSHHSFLKAQNISENVNSEFISIIDSIYSTDFLLKNGRYYIPEYPRAKGNPFFLTDKWTSNELILDKTIYKDILLLYDIYKDRVICIIKGVENEEIPIILNNNIITGFTLLNHRFVNSENNKFLSEKGLYEVIYIGKELEVFAKWKKKYLRIYTRENLGEFDTQKRSMFIVKNEKLYPVKKNKDFIKLFPEEKKQIKSLIKLHHIKLHKSENEDLIDLFKKCNELIQIQLNNKK